MKTVNGIGKESNITELTLSSEASGLVSQYKDIIREQDYKLQTLTDSLRHCQDETEALKRQLFETQQSEQQTNSQLFDQNILLKAQLAALTSQQKEESTPNATNGHSISHSTQISFYEAENVRLVKEVAELNHKLNEALEMTEQSLKLTELGRLRKDQEDLLELLNDQVSFRGFTV